MGPALLEVKSNLSKLAPLFQGESLQFQTYSLGPLTKGESSSEGYLSSLAQW